MENMLTVILPSLFIVMGVAAVWLKNKEINRLKKDLNHYNTQLSLMRECVGDFEKQLYLSTRICSQHFQLPYDYKTGGYKIKDILLKLFDKWGYDIRDIDNTGDFNICYRGTTVPVNTDIEQEKIMLREREEIIRSRERKS